MPETEKKAWWKSETLVIHVISFIFAIVSASGFQPGLDLLNGVVGSAEKDGIGAALALAGTNAITVAMRLFRSEYSILKIK